MRASFSGHESFQCKSLWLKKGYDFVTAGKSFNDEYAVVDLGVGKNMVSAIRYWLKSFGIIDDKGSVTPLADYLFGKDGRDLFLEDIGTLWILHFHLVTGEVATLYNIVFTEFNRMQRAFSRGQLSDYIKRLFANKRFGTLPYTESTINRDISTLLKNYVRPTNPKAIDDFSAVLLNLNLIKKLDRDSYEFSSSTNGKLNPLIFLYAILCSTQEKVVEYTLLLQLANIFGMSVNELNDIIHDLVYAFPQISYSNVAGEQLFSISEPVDKWDVLNQYYALKS